MPAARKRTAKAAKVAAKEEVEEVEEAEEAPAAKKPKLTAAQKAAEKDAAEKERLKSQEETILKLLKEHKEKPSELGTEPDIYMNGLESSDESNWAYAVLSAVEGGDLPRLTALLESRAVLVSFEGKPVASSSNSSGPLEIKEHEDFHFEVSCGFPEESPLVKALERNNVAAASLLWKYFNPAPVSRISGLKAVRAKPVDSSIINQTIDSVAGSTRECSLECFTWMLQNFQESFVQRLPQFTLSAMRLGHRDLVRRCLRYLLQLDWAAEDLDSSEVLSSASSSSSGSLKRAASLRRASSISGSQSQGSEAGSGTGVHEVHGVTLLHLAALEAKRPKQLPEPLNEDTTNAPALKHFITPVHLAGLNPNSEILEALVKAGGDITIEDDQQFYVHHYAAVSKPADSFLAETPPKPGKKAEKPKPKAEVKEPLAPVRGSRRAAVKATAAVTFGRAPAPKADPGADSDDEDAADAFADADSPAVQMAKKLRKHMKPSRTLVYLMEEMFPGVSNPFKYINTARKLLKRAVDALRFHNVAYLLYSFPKAFLPNNYSRVYDYNGEHAILRAAAEGDTDVLRLLLAGDAFRAKVYNDKQNLDDLLEIAIQNRRPDVCRVILGSDLGASPDEVLLQKAIEQDSLKITKLLVEEYGVPINSGAVSLSPLHVAVSKDFIECAQWLISRGAKLRAPSTKGITPMQAAARAGKVASVKLLADSGVSLLKAVDEEPKDEKEEDEEEESDAMVTEDEGAFEGWHIVLTGVFSVSKSLIKEVIEANGGKVAQTVNSKTTHCCYSGRDGFTDYGQPMGKGDSKYREAKKKKLPFIDEQTILRHMKRSQHATMAREGFVAPVDDAVDKHATLLHDVLSHCGNWDLIGPVVTFLLDHGADVCARNREGQTALHILVQKALENEQNHRMLKLVLERGAKVDPTFVNWTDAMGYGAIVWALGNSRWEFAKTLIEFPGFDLDFVIREPTVADSEKKEESGKEAMDVEGGDGNGDSDEAEPNSKTKAPYLGWTLLSLIIEKNGPAKLFALALSLGADPNLVPKTERATPPIVAASCNMEYVRELLPHPKLNPNAADIDGKTLLHQLLTGGSQQPLFPSEVRNPNNNNQSGFGMSYFHNHYHHHNIQDPIQNFDDCLKLCPKLDLTVKDANGRTLLHYASGYLQMTTCCRHLLNKPGVELDAQDKHGNTALAIALRKLNQHLALFLLDSGANFNLKMSVLPNEIGQNVHTDQNSEEVPRVSVSVYEFAMHHTLQSVLYVLMNSPVADLTEVLSASITTGKLNYAQQMVQKVGISVEHASTLLLLLFGPRTKNAETEVIQLATKLLPSAAPETADEAGYTTLHLAVKHEHSAKVVNFLMTAYQSRGENVLLKVLSTPDARGQTVLHTAVLSKQIPTVRQLLGTVGSRVQAPQAKTKDAEQAQFLRFVNHQDDQGSTALHYALQTNALGAFRDNTLVAVLCSYGADPLVCNKAGLSPAAIVGDLPANYLPGMCRALAGRILDEEGGEESDKKGKEDAARANWTLSPELQKVVDAAQAKRKEREKLSEDKRKTKIGARKKGFEELQSRMEKFRKNREASEAKKKAESETSAAEKRTRELAKLGKLAIPVDQSCPQWNLYRVYVDEEGVIYDAPLTFTDVKASVFGSNSYYIIQLVELTPEANRQRLLQMQNSEGFTFNSCFGLPKYKLFERWGRVGDYGQTKVRPLTNAAAAVQQFEKAFYQRTGVTWEERSDASPATSSSRKNMYSYISKAYEEIEEPATADQEAAEEAAAKASSLASEVQILLRCITNLTALRNSLKQEGGDATPMGGLSRQTISDGWRILSEIAELIEQQEKIKRYRGKRLRELRQDSAKLKQSFTELSNRFYMTVPHDFGDIERGFTRPEVIDNKDLLHAKSRMLQAMEDVETSLNLLMGNIDQDSSKKGKKGAAAAAPSQVVSLSRASRPSISRLENLYSLMGVDLKPVSKQSARFQLIKEYAQKSSPGVKIAEVVKVTRWQDSVRFLPHAKERLGANSQERPNNLLLWHGSSVSNILGILLTGLRIAPPEAPVSGYMFGKGIYFADAFQKSTNYTASRRGLRGYNRWGDYDRSEPYSNYSVIFLCEVALGESLPLLEATDEGFVQPPEGYQSVQGCGKNAPAPSGMFVLNNGVGVPLGNLTPVNNFACLNYNEFIVYDESRVKIRYAVLFED